MAKQIIEEADIPQETSHVRVNPWAVQVDDFDQEETLYNMKKNGSLDAGVQTKSGIILPNELGNLKYIFQDLLAGDSSVMDTPEMKNINFNNIIKSIEWLASSNQLNDKEKTSLLSDGWRLNFKCKPPTPQEFLSEKFIGAQAESTYAWAKDTFCEFFDPLKPYRTLILAQHIGSGKSTISTLVQLFISVHYAMMWHPYRYFGLAPSSIFTQCMGGWNQKKASELLIEPFIQILECSPYFKRVRSHTDLVDASAEEITDCLHWTTSSPTSVLSFQNGVNYKIINGAGSILGQSIISAVLSEITMFTENGWTNEKVFTFFTKLRKRIDSRMKGNYYGRFILDSQPNTLESVIDEWIWSKETRHNKQNLIVTGSRWKFFPEEFKDAWERPRDDWKQEEHLKKDFKHAFPVFKGGDGQPPKVIESEGELSMYDNIDVIWAPMKQETSNGIVDVRDNALESPIEFLRDQCGIPSGAADRIFYNPHTIEACFDNNLRNMFGQITAPAEEEPEHLIWNQIRDKFFNKIVDKYYFYYEPGIPRAVSVDQSYAGDVTSISMTHVERDPERKDDVTGEPLKVFVTDFTITIIPKGGIINLDAIRCFIWDLISLGNLKIKHASFDGFMSQPSIQFLKRKGVLVDQLSVDKTNEPYLNYIDYVFHGRWNTGRCIYAKNNMKSIQMVKRKTGKQTTKIEHMNGDIVTDGDGNWDTDQRGVNAKDALDSIVGSIELINRYDNEFIPFVVWKPHSLNDRSYETMKKRQNAFLEKSGLFI